MAGLRALCCSKSDRKNDDQPIPSKPSTQPRPEKQTQKPPANVTTERSSTDVTEEKPGPRDLWKEAYEGLNPDCKTYVSRNGASATDAVNGVIEQTTARYEEWKKGGLRVPRKNREDINLRDSAERIINAAMKTSDLISKFVSFDPTGHASSAWTVISFGMSIVQNTLDRRDAIFAASEYLAETLAYYALIDANYRNQGVGSDHDLDKALLRVYAAILRFTAEVKKAQDESAASRTAESVFALTEQPLSQLKKAVKEQGAVAQQWASLAANLGDRKVAAVHLAKIKSVESKVLTAEEECQMSWISTAAYSSRQRELQKKRTGETGSWLLESKEYLDWKYNSGGLLWLPGISGCGKSVLCSTVIRDIEEECQLDDARYLAYWYFQFSDEKTQSVDSMIRSLIRQLSRSPLLPSVIKLWEEHHLKGSQPDSRAISDLLDDVVSSIPGNVYLIFDALDECPVNAYSKERTSLLSLLTGLLERHRRKLHILTTSRAEQDIKEKLEVFPKIDLEAHLAEDVKSFVTTSIAQAPLKRLSESIKGLIQEKLLSSKERRFRWAELQIAEIEKCRREKDIEAALNTIPQTLEASYLKILNALEPRDVPLARDIFMVICTSPVVLDLKTVAAIVGLDFPDSILDICTSSLVSEFDGQVRVAHFSVQEFLVVDEDNHDHHECQFSAMDGHRFLATNTVDCLLERTHLLTEPEVMELHSFVYAAQHWHTHVAALRDNDPARSELQPKINRLFTEPNVYFNWMRGTGNDSLLWRYEGSELAERCEWPIQTASRMGLVHTVEELMNRGADVEALGQTSSPRRALQAAAGEGHEKVVQILLDRGANINAEAGSWASTALEEASWEGHKKIVQMLLDRGADVNHEGSNYGSALKAATTRGHQQIMQLLLDHGADVFTRKFVTGSLVEASSQGNEQSVRMLLHCITDIDAQEMEYRNSLEAATRAGYTGIVRMLLDRATDINGPNVCGQYYDSPPIQIASYRGYEEIVRMLLDRGADANASDLDDGSALQSASFNGNVSIVRLLLDHGANINAQEGNPWTPLQTAARRGHEKVVQLLLDRGANVNARKGGYDSTALHFASSEGHGTIVQMLLDHGADPNMQGADLKRNGDPIFPTLTHAVNSGQNAIAQMLLDRGADINAPGKDGLTALMSASAKGSEDMVQMLLDRGADINANWESSGALQLAVFGGHENIVQILLNRGADVNLKGSRITALQAAASEGDEKIIQILLDRGADVNLRNEECGTALHFAACEGHEKIVHLLLDRGADINAIGEEIGSALHVAASEGHEKIMQILLDWGADVNLNNEDCGTALHVAASEGYEKIVQLLLDRGADVNAHSEKLHSALQAAAAEGHEKVVQLLLDRGADINLRGGDLGSAFEEASSNGHEAIVRLLLDRGAEQSET